MINQEQNNENNNTLNLIEVINNEQQIVIRKESGEIKLERKLNIIERYLNISQEENNDILKLLVFWSFQDQNKNIVQGIYDCLKVDILNGKVDDVFKQFPLKIEMISKNNNFENHDFNENALKVEVEIAIKNIKSKEALNFLFEIDGQEDQKYIVEGCSKTVISELGQNSVFRLRVNFFFLEPGFYNISKYSVTFFSKKDSSLTLYPIDLLHNSDTRSITYTADQFNELKYISIK